MCPRCASLKSKIVQVGSKTDMNNRLKLARVDNASRRFDIEAVRKILFQKGINVTSIKIDRILGPISAVPTRVGISLKKYPPSQAHIFSLECFLRLFRVTSLLQI